MAVILIGVVSILLLFENGLANMTTAATRMEVAILASNFFEEMKSFGYSNLPASGTVSALAAVNAGRITDFPAPFQGTVTVSALNENLDGVTGNDYADKSGNSTLKEIQLVISSPGTRFKNATLTARIGR